MADSNSVYFSSLAATNEMMKSNPNLSRYEAAKLAKAQNPQAWGLPAKPSSTAGLSTTATTSAQATQQAVNAVAPSSLSDPLLGLNPQIDAAISGATDTDPFAHGVTNDPSMFQPQDLGTPLDNTGTSAIPGLSTAPTVNNTGSISGSGGNLTAIQDAYNNALKTGSQQANAINHQNMLNGQLGAALVGTMNNSASALQQNDQANVDSSSQSLASILATLNSGNKGAQTGWDAQNVSSEIQQQQDMRNNITNPKRKGVGVDETKTYNPALQSAIIKKTNLLGL